jgi:hypothetical protein
LVVFVVFFDLWSMHTRVYDEVTYQYQKESITEEQEEVFEEYRSSNRLHAPYPQGLSKEEILSLMKQAGCVADGFLSGYGDEEEIGTLLAKSECEYAHRAVETWREPPDFEEAVRIMELVGRPMIYGMFIAEAIDVNDDYTYGVEGRDFRFREMCKNGSKNYWGEHTCVPHTSRGEYRKYLQQITRDAMHSGVRVFLFGQVFMQDDPRDSHLPEIIREMREYAQFLHIDIVIGAQTNTVSDEEYLRMFDFVEGGVGLLPSGETEDSVCFSRYWRGGNGWCWALLAHEAYASRANNVFVHFDWNGNVGDEMNRFAHFSKEKRSQVLQDTYWKYQERDIGFLFPFLTPLDEINGGCYGEKARYYSPDNAYGCQDEDVMNAVMEEAKKRNPQ